MEHNSAAFVAMSDQLQAGAHEEVSALIHGYTTCLNEHGRDAADAVLARTLVGLSNLYLIGLAMDLVHRVAAK